MANSIAAWITAVASFITALSVLLAAVGLHQGVRQRVFTLENFYIERYWQLMDRLSISALRGRSIEESDREIIVAYLVLCEDELDLRASGRISDSTWGIWRSGIAVGLDHRLIREVWQEVCADVEIHPYMTGSAFERLMAFEHGETDPYHPRRRLEPYMRGLRGLRGL